MRIVRPFIVWTGLALGLMLLLSGCDLLKIFKAPAPYGAQQISVTLKEWQLIPAHLAAKAGKVRFIVSNQGTVPHGFEVEGPGVEEEIDPFPAGQTRTLELELAPGTYEVYCQVPGHKEQGMKGELIVQP